MKQLGYNKPVCSFGLGSIQSRKTCSPGSPTRRGSCLLLSLCVCLRDVHESGVRRREGEEEGKEEQGTKGRDE